jgi:flagellar hook-length control protein FliK
MITQLLLTPPPKPASDSSTSANSPAITNTSASTNTNNSSGSALSDPTALTDFKRALQSARVKHKTTQTTPTAPVVAKKAAPTAVKTKVVVAPTSDDEPSETADPTASAAAEEETAETSAKTATVLPATPQSTKSAAKKGATSTSENETESSSSEKTEVAPQLNLVQAITPDKQQSRGGKQQKSGEKPAAKSDSTQVQISAAASVPVTPSSSNVTTVDTNQPGVSSEKSDQAPATESQTGIKPRNTRPVNDSTTQAVSSDDSTSDATSADPADTESAADIDASSDSTASTPAATSSTPAPTPHAVAAITTTLDAVAGIMPTHSIDPTSESPSVSPTRAFTEANQDQIVTTIKGQLLPDGGTMQITLNPANLGHVHISVQVTAGSVSATFETSNDQATRLLSHSLGQLKQTLEAAGVTVEKLQVTQSRDSQSSSQGDAKQSSQQQTATDQRSTNQEQQRREILQQMWDKIAGADDWIDVKA